MYIDIGYNARRINKVIVIKQQEQYSQMYNNIKFSLVK